MRPIRDVARDLGIADEHFIPYGYDKAKIHQDALAAAGERRGKLVLVSALTPTSAGEGKTTTSIALAQGLAHVGQSVCLALREPSLGPTFGMKGGATGAGKASVTPAHDINLHFTGDFHAISSAHNLLAAAIDNHLHQGNKLDIDPRRVEWPRVVDMNDRALRSIILGLGGPIQGVPREGSFDITTASEVMAVLCLADSLDDLRARLSRLIVAQTYGKETVTASDLNAVGAMMVLLKDAVHPNLVQTLEGVPALIHGGPFANIAHGCNSIVATRTAMAHADWTVTEAGFGFDLGGEKFLDIKCQAAGLDPAAVVLVATIKALKRHGGVADKDLGQPDAAAVERGLPNLQKHLENARLFGKQAVVALNHFTDSDTDEEVDIVRRACAEWGASFAVCKGVAEGGPGAAELAETVMAAAEAGAASPLKPLYDWSEPLEDKMEKIATRIYGADGVEYTSEGQRDFKKIERMGFAGLPLCVVKTPMSFSDNARLAGRPEGFKVTVRGAVLAAGAGFVVPLLGSVLRMPGLPKVPQLELMDLVDGRVEGMK